MQRVLLLLLTVAALIAPARADEPLFINPFATAAELRALRGATPASTIELVYELRRSQAGRVISVERVVIELGEDWALFTDDRGSRLHDYRLRATFWLNPARSRFTVTHKLAVPFFRFYEFANRALLAKMLADQQLDRPLQDACDVETELSVSIPQSDFHGQSSIARTDTAFTVTCDGRTVSTLTFDTKPQVPPSLWPTLLAELPMHSRLASEVSTLPWAPQQLEVNFTPVVGTAMTLSLNLLDVQPASSPYPVGDSAANDSAETWPQSIPALPDLLKAVMVGGPPILSVWDDKLRQLALDGDGSKAALALLPMLSMFPEAVRGCTPGNKTALCLVVLHLDLYIAQDSAVAAAYRIVNTQPNGDMAGTLAAMRSAQGSKLAADPVLGETFALALLEFGPSFSTQARDAGLPSDPLPLMLAALEAYPYNPSYWADLSDYFSRQFDMESSLKALAVAKSLSPADPDALADAKLQRIMEMAEHARQFFLPD